MSICGTGAIDDTSPWVYLLIEVGSNNVLAGTSASMASKSISRFRR